MKMAHLPEVDPNAWMKGKNEASIVFVREAEEYLKNHELEEGDASRLRRVINLIKTGRFRLTNHQSVHGYLNGYR